MSRAYAILIVALVVATWAIYLLAQGVQLAWSFLVPFSAAVGLLTSAAFAFKHWAWHWPVVHLLTKTPRLAGTWVGQLRSNSIHDGETQPRAPSTWPWWYRSPSMTERSPVHSRVFLDNSGGIRL